MKIAFVTINANKQWASYRWRAAWPARYLGADLLNMEDIANDPEYPLLYDAYIFVKAGIPAFQERAIKAGKQLWLDVCDPTWWFGPDAFREIAADVTGIVASCEPLAADCALFTGRPVMTIPDRVEMSEYPRRRIQRPSDPVRLIWYGGSQNRIAMFGGIANLERLHANGYHTELTILDDRPDYHWGFPDWLPVYYVKWSEETRADIIAAHDIAFLPPYPGPWGKVKSNNKTLTAWASGLPATDAQDYEAFADLVGQAAVRREEAEAGLRLLVERYNVEQSAEEWRRLLCA